MLLARVTESMWLAQYAVSLSERACLASCAVSSSMFERVLPPLVNLDYSETVWLPHHTVILFEIENCIVRSSSVSKNVLPAVMGLALSEGVNLFERVQLVKCAVSRLTLPAAVSIEMLWLAHSAVKNLSLSQRMCLVKSSLRILMLPAVVTLDLLDTLSLEQSVE